MRRLCAQAHPERRAALNKKRYIVIFAASIAVVAASVCVYLNSLSETVAANLMGTVDEISRHDVETIEGSLDNSYSRLESVAKRLAVYDVTTVQEAQEQLNLEAASSDLFNAIYLLGSDGTLYSSSYLRLEADEHSYDELFADGREHWVMLYDDADGKLETTKESLIYGVRMAPMEIAGRTFIAMLARSDLSAISEQLLIESFDGHGVSSVVNSAGYYIVSASPATDLAGRDNFYAMLEGGRLEGGITLQDVRRNIAEGRDFVVNCVTADGEDLVLSFAPVQGTSWSFIMAVPTYVFSQRFAPFVTMTAGMLFVVVVVLIGMLALIYRFMRRSVLAKAEAAARSEFLSNMSHEIRTPLNGIIGLSHLMGRHLEDRSAMEGYLRKLDKSARYLLSLVNDILDVSKLQAGKVELVSEPFDLRGAIENVCEMEREAMESRQICFDAQHVELPWPWVIGDEVRLSQVLMNILSNAAKFTPAEGQVTLAATQQLTPAGTHALTTISIADTGCGMSEEFKQHIFDTFSQERNSNAESQKGTGLGMAISHLLTKEMGGTLKVESELGKGSCFIVSVPLLIDATRRHEAPPEALPEERRAAKPPAAAADASLMRVLVAEDNELNADIISSILGEEGYEVTVASDGREAVDAFRASPVGHFGAILMDAQMPVMDGYEAAREIRCLDREDARKVRIFACTASTFTEDRNRALESGMDDFLAKPLNMPVMLEKLEQARRDAS